MNINLLPEDTVSQRYSFSIAVVSVAIMITLIFVFLFLGFIQRSNVQRDAVTLNNLQAQLSQMESRTAGLQSQIGRIHSRTEYSSNPLSADVRDLFESLLRAQTTGMSILNLSWDGKSITMNGTCHSIPSLTKYERTIAGIHGIRNVWVSSTNSGDKGQIQFMLSCDFGV